MAQTKRKRRSTKHRGNAAGIVEARGRTSRNPDGYKGPRGKPGERYEKEPNWNSAMQRAAIAAIGFGVLLVALFKQEPLPAAGMTAAVFCFYVPLGYYTDVFLYKRKLAKQQAAKAK